MFGINGGELIVIAIVAVLVIGPQRLPEYAEKLRNFIREARRMAAGAKDTIREEAGVDLDSVDWKKLDPRQYDPRRIIREALLDDEPGTSSSGSTGFAGLLASGTAATAVAAAPAISSAAPTAAAASTTAAPAVVPQARLGAGEPAPWDSEAT